MWNGCFFVKGGFSGKWDSFAATFNVSNCLNLTFSFVHNLFQSTLMYHTKYDPVDYGVALTVTVNNFAVINVTLSGMVHDICVI